MPPLTWADARARRLVRSHLVTPVKWSGLVGMVRDVCGLQAQMLSAAELAISARVVGATSVLIRDALWVERSLVRAWTVRGTIHIVPATDLALWIAALGSRRYWESKEWLEREGLTPREAGAIFDTVVDAMGDDALTRVQIADAVATRLGKRFRPKIASMWGDLLGPVTYMGRLCFGPTVGPNVTFVRADRWVVRKWQRHDPDAAWRELVTRFLRTYAPTTTEGVGRFFGLESANVLAILRSLDGATEVTVEGRKAWMLKDDRAPRGDASSVRLLAQYDNYVIGSHPRETLVAPAAQARIRTYRRGQWEGAVGVPVLVVDGVVGGVWERRTRRGRVEIQVESQIPLTAKRRRAVMDEGERIGRFLGRAADVSLV